MTNEIVLGEESNEVTHGRLLSHLERHIKLYESGHGPLAREFSGHWQEARHAAVHSLSLREKLWDEVLAEVRALLETSA